MLAEGSLAYFADETGAVEKGRVHLDGDAHITTSDQGTGASANEFTLHSGKRALRLWAATADEREEWVQVLHAAIAAMRRSQMLQ